MAYVAWIFLGIAFCIAGEVFSKIWAERPTLHAAAICMIAYSASVIPWLCALRIQNRLIFTFLFWTIIQACAAVVIGICFQEKMSPCQWIGVVFGMASLALLCL